MKTTLISTAIALTLIAPAAISAERNSTGTAPSRIAAKVVSVGDGDTVRVRGANQTLIVRLACIDAV